jgi:GAF domain-containing protein
MSFCAHAVLSKRPWSRTRSTTNAFDNPLVLGAPHIRFYAGAPLRLADGQVVGTLCLIDTAPRAFEIADVETLADYAQLVEREVRRKLIRSRTAHERDRRSLAISEARFTTVFRKRRSATRWSRSTAAFSTSTRPFGDHGLRRGIAAQAHLRRRHASRRRGRRRGARVELLAGKQSTYTTSVTCVPTARRSG